jgi:hypothetical protein
MLEGGCQRRGGHEPYAPLLAALRRHIHHASPAQQRTELAGCAWLVRLLPELANGPIEPLPAWTLPPEQERRLMVEAVLRFLANVAGPTGTLLVLDDLQWASPDALDVLTALARAAAEVPLRVLGAYRHTEVGPHDPLSVMLADLAQARLAMQHTLPPLTPQEAGQLLAGLLADHGTWQMRGALRCYVRYAIWQMRGAALLRYASWRERSPLAAVDALSRSPRKGSTSPGPRVGTELLSSFSRMPPRDHRFSNRESHCL